MNPAFKAFKEKGYIPMLAAEWSNAYLPNNNDIRNRRRFSATHALPHGSRGVHLLLPLSQWFAGSHGR
jgi:hypothetical protein